ncbi:unnamed protein product [Cuscuta epithymum]|uniref:Ubiquitin carboxyl-terminal hydrolase n=1 Tax=Cuscuta epithymum TaxID=186058 RepID=A0AAV0DHY2_9ASTE|nr:unnamed protein product [Cuscuta epithymum]
MGRELPETISSPLNSPGAPGNITNISGQVRCVTEWSLALSDFTEKGSEEAASDDFCLKSLPPVRSDSHWSQPWSIQAAANLLDPKFYGGLDSKGAEPDWTDTWSLNNGPDHRFSASVSGLSGLDWNWEANPMIKECSECSYDVKEQTVELENVPFFSSMDEWKRTEERKEHAALGDHSLLNFFWDEKTPLSMGGGLANLGNTCFLNAVLQCFMHIVPLVQSIEAYNHPSPCEACSEGYCVLCDLKELTNATLGSKGSIIHPWKIVNNLSSVFLSSFQRYQQEDAHEFLLCFLDRLERSCSSLKMEGQLYSNHENIVNQTFGGLLISKLQCFNCGHCSKTHEPLVDMSLEIRDVDSLPMALDSFTKIEKIEDPMTKFTCEKCKLQVLIEKQLLLDETPLVATFHLKRFKNDGFRVEKIDKHIMFPLELDLLPYVDRQKKPAESKYNLVAVLVHIGLSLHSGHYYCFIHASPNEWYMFDDSKVIQVQEDLVMSQAAYVLFYVRQDTPWFSHFIETKQPTPSSFSSNLLFHNVDPISNPSPIMESGSIHSGVDTSEEQGKENVCNSSDISSADTEKKRPNRLVFKDNNNKREFGITGRLADAITTSPSRSPSQHGEVITDNYCSNPCAQQRLSDKISCKDQYRKHFVGDPEGKQACSVKTNMPSVAASLMKGCMKKKRRREVVSVRECGLSPYGSLLSHPLKASHLR